MPPNYKPLEPRKVRFIVVHCSATRPSMDIGRKEIDLWHRQQGWAEIGYHKVIRRDGTVEDGRPMTVPGAHVRNYNGQSVGICLVGGVTEKNVNVAEDNFTRDQFTALMEVLRETQARFPAARIVGHRDLDPKKACPSFDVAAWLLRNPL